MVTPITPKQVGVMVIRDGMAVKGVTPEQTAKGSAISRAKFNRLLAGDMNNHSELYLRAVERYLGFPRACWRPVSLSASK